MEDRRCLLYISHSLAKDCGKNQVQNSPSWAPVFQLQVRFAPQIPHAGNRTRVKIMVKGTGIRSAGAIAKLILMLWFL